MNDINAALGLAQLKKLEASNKKRRLLAARYTRNLCKLPGIVCPTVKSNVVSSQHNYVIRTDQRDKLHLYLRDNGVSSGVHYMPLYMHPYYRTEYKNICLPVTDREWLRILLLPLYPQLTVSSQNRIIDLIKKFFQSNMVNHQADIAQASEITIRPVREEEIEKIRVWRNSNRKYFVTQNIITPKMQLNWFKNVYKKDPNDTLYIIYYKDEPIGTLSMIKRGKDFEMGRVLLGEKKYARRGVIGMATEKLLNKYKTKKKTQRVYLEVLKENKVAISFYRKHSFTQVGVKGKEIVMERYV